MDMDMDAADYMFDSSVVASVMEEIDRLQDQWPPEDEAEDAPPAYDNFPEAYMQWRKGVKALHRCVAISQDPEFIGAEKNLRQAQALLKKLKIKSEEVFKATHAKRSSFSSVFKIKAPKLLVPTQAFSRGRSAPVSPVDNDGKSSSPRSSIDVARVASHDSHHPDNDPFRLAHQEEVKKEQEVYALEELVAKFKRNKAALDHALSGSNLAWIQLRRIADHQLANRPELASQLGLMLEKLEGAEAAFSVAKKKTADFTRARQAVQHAHLYFTKALGMFDNIRTLSLTRSMSGMLSGGYNDQTNLYEYQAGVTQSSRAQICLKEVFRVMKPWDHLIPEDLKEDYTKLSTQGLMQASKIYNLLYGGRITDSGTRSSVNVMLQRQEAAFAHLTHLAVWVQDYVPVCVKEEHAAVIPRDDVRAEIAGFWDAQIDSGARDGESGHI